jgi:FkbM family methyltransferase
MIAILLRYFTAFKGKPRLARLLLGNRINQIKDVLVKGKYGCTFKIPNIIENVGFDIYIDGVFEKKTIELIMQKLPPAGVLVDMGANIGSISLPVCKHRPDVNAICIEAAERVYGYLDFNVKLNELTNCTIINKALTDTDGAIVNFFSPDEKFGKGSLTSIFTKDAKQVETIRLDTLLRQHEIGKVDFIKADIEGYEYHAFKGAEKLLSAEKAPDILFEFVDWA